MNQLNQTIEGNKTKTTEQHTGIINILQRKHNLFHHILQCTTLKQNRQDRPKTETKILREQRFRKKPEVKNSQVEGRKNNDGNESKQGEKQKV